MRKRIRTQLTPEESLVHYKAEHLKAARELCYSNEILTLIQNAQTENDVLRAMIRGRREMKG